LPAEIVAKLRNESSVEHKDVAQALVESGHVGTVEEAFERYLGYGCPGYVPKFPLTPVQAIRLIVEAGGLAVLPHPTVLGANGKLREWVAEGLEGIEVYHPWHRRDDERRFHALAQLYGLEVLGGSDYHGIDADYAGIGSARVPYEMVERVRNRLAKRSKENRNRTKIPTTDKFNTKFYETSDGRP